MSQYPFLKNYTAILCVFVLGMITVFSGCIDDSDVDETPSGPACKATIRRTAYGIPHITADDYAGLGFGQGYAAAEDRLCIIADQIVKVRSERSLYFGPGENNANIEIDFAYKALQVYPKASVGFAEISGEMRDFITGYAEGYNQFLLEADGEDTPPDCRGKPWIKPISATDLMAYYLDIAMLAGSRNFLDYIAAAAPPSNTSLTRSTRKFEPPPSYGAASNGIVLGRDKTKSGKGMVLSNTHLPWEGELKYHEVHLTIPGQLNVAGVTLSGAVGVLIGFNDNLAWTHTTSTSNQFTVYKLKLSENDSLSYKYDDTEKQISSFTSDIQVLQPDGSLQTFSRAFYRSHYGPMLEAPALGLDWTDETAYTIKDMNAGNYNLLEPFINMARSRNLDEFVNVFRTKGGIPWNNTMAADKNGDVFYADTTLTPNLSSEALAAYKSLLETDLTTSIFKSFDVVLLDGSNSLFEWRNDPSATLEGAIPFDDAPQLRRTDYAANMNDSYWMPNHLNPLAGVSPLYGPERTVLTPRSRMGFTMIQDMGGSDRRFTLEELQTLMFCNRSLTAELFVDDLVAVCLKAGEISVDGEIVELSAVCEILAGWDRRFNLDSPGAVLFREFMGEYGKAEIINGSDLYATPFDPDNPIKTPNTLKPDAAPLNLARAAQRLQKENIPLDASFRGLQFTKKGDEKISVHGGLQVEEGAFNKVHYSDSESMITTIIPRMDRKPVVNSATGLTTEGYLINYGSSYVLTVEFTDNGPEAQAVMAYSQSDNPESPHFTDQTRLYAEKKWRPVLFDTQDILNDPQMTERVVSK